MSVKNPKQWETVTTYNPAYGNALSQVDPNGRRTEAMYDALGRSTAVWKPGRDKAAGPTPTVKIDEAAKAGGVGRYSRKDNSCLTHCGLVAQAGGYLPFQGKSPLEITEMMKDMLGTAYKRRR
jgi:YD repeat-containing protein